ncbi:MAG: nucleotide exchange factor GrpE [Clostridia bacterium]
MKKNNDKVGEEVLNNSEEQAPCDTEEVLDAEKLLQIADSKVKEYKELAQRVQAEFENYRKRNNDSVKQARYDGGNEIILGMLPIVDTVETALTMIKDAAVAEGVGLIHKQILSFLSKHEVEEVESLNKPFNPDFHDAIMQVEDEERSGLIVEVLQKGYIRAGKVIRYAMVKVGK